MPIDFENVTYTYFPNTPFAEKVLNGISLHVEDGECVALIGHTGCGKSTLIQHINALNQPTEGEVVVNGIDTKGPKARLTELRRQVGLVFQYPEYQLFEETVEKDVAFGPNNMGLPAEEVDRRVSAALELVGIDRETVGKKSPFEISGGQRRRVAIAGVLAMEPQILILDEPSAGLDPAGRKEMLEIIRQVHRQRGCTVLFVTHNMNEAAQIADRILVLEKGTVLMDDTPEKVFSRGEELMRVGLDVPDVVRLCTLLRRRGIEVPADIMTPAALCAFVRQRAGGGSDV